MMHSLKMSSSTRCIKYLMFIFNLIFVITGIILLSIGSVIHGVYYNYQHFLDNRFLSVPSLCIAVGSIIFLIAFFGCCGAVRENYCMIVTFATLMVLVFILEFSAGISGYVLKSSASEVIKEKMKTSMKEYPLNNTEIVNIWDMIQQEFECCGTDDPKEWLEIINNNSNNGTNFLPPSCCPHKEGANGEPKCQYTTSDRYTGGCLTSVTTFIKAHAVQLGGAGFGIAFIQALGIWFSVFLAKTIRRNYENM